MEHDPLCPEPECERSCGRSYCDEASHYCGCDLIAKVRADEREKAGQRVADPYLHEAWCDLSRPHGPSVCDCYHAACIAAARGES